MTPDMAMEQALAHHHARRFADAERVYRSILQRQPQHAAVTHFLGLALVERNAPAEALPLLARSIALQPRDPGFLVRYSQALLRFGDPAAAVDIAARAAAIAPTDGAVLRQFAAALTAARRFAEAASQWSELARREPSDPLPAFRAAEAADFAGDLPAAAAAYEQALRLRPDFVEAAANLGGVLLRLGRFEDAIRWFTRADALRPGNASIESSLGAALLEQGRVGEALRWTRSAVERDPDNPQCWQWNLAHALAAAGLVDESIETFAAALERAPRWPSLFSDRLLTQQYAVPDRPPALSAMHREYERRYGHAARPSAPAPIRADAGRARIGYVSADFRSHPVGRFIAPLLAAHDKGRFEVHCFSNHAGADDAWTGRIRGAADRWHRIGTLDDDAAERLIRSQGIDVLIDLSGHTAGNRLPLFMRRCAPLQATYLGYANTTGLSAIDIRLTDAVVDPAGMDSLYRERLVRLPVSFGLFEPIEAAPSVGPLPALANGHVTFGCVGRRMKVNAAVLDAWADLLLRLPDARLVLVGAGYDDPWMAERLLEPFERRGVQRARLELIGRLSFDDYLRLHGRIDLMLDTFPVNGHTTTLQGLWMGVPIVTLAGESARARLGASVLHALGLEAFVADGVEAYVDRAIGQAQDLDRLARLRKSLRERMLASALMDAAGFARHFEAALLDALASRR